MIFFQGHAAPILYAAWAEAGLFPRADLMNLRKIDNDLEGHPTPVRYPDLSLPRLANLPKSNEGIAK